MLVIWQSFSDCFSIFLFCKLWGSTETSIIKQGSRFLTFCKSSFQTPEHRPQAEPSRPEAFSQAKMQWSLFCASLTLSPDLSG